MPSLGRVQGDARPRNKQHATSVVVLLQRARVHGGRASASELVLRDLLRTRDGRPVVLTPLEEGDYHLFLSHTVHPPGLEL